MELIAQKREIKGKAVKNLRYQGLTPSVIIGKGLEMTLLEYLIKLVKLL
jgi:ribosomal protein L25 (general stress protein Ctc)